MRSTSFLLLLFLQLSLSTFCGDSSVASSDGGAVPGSAEASAAPPPASRQSPRALAKAGASSRCSTKAVVPLWDRLCPRAKLRLVPLFGTLFYRFILLRLVYVYAIYTAE